MMHRDGVCLVDATANGPTRDRRALTGAHRSLASATRQGCRAPGVAGVVGCDDDPGVRVAGPVDDASAGGTVTTSVCRTALSWYTRDDGYDHLRGHDR